MNQDELLREMESLVEGVEQSFSVLIGVVAETSDPSSVLRHLLSAEGAVSKEFGPNGWRDRIVRKMQLMAALKAQPAAQSDASLQALISTLLKAQTDPDRGERH